MIHYDTLGVAAPNLTDLDENNIPDYVDEVNNCRFYKKCFS